MVIVRAPNANYSGVSAGVKFVNGVGETDNPSALAYFRRQGYEVVTPEPESQRDEILLALEEGRSLTGFRRDELADVAVEVGVEIADDATKAQIIEALTKPEEPEQGQGDSDGDDNDEPDDE